MVFGKTAVEPAKPAATAETPADGDKKSSYCPMAKFNKAEIYHLKSSTRVIKKLSCKNCQSNESESFKIQIFLWAC